MARLVECVTAIRALLAGREVSHRGLVSVDQARLYVRPREVPPLYAAAISPETAEWAGAWADGLVTVARPSEELARVVEAFRRGGGAGKPLLLQSQVSYAPTQEQAAAEAFARWPNAGLPAPLLAELRLPAEVDLALASVRPEDVAANVRVSSDPAQHLRWLLDDAELGFDAVYVHNVAADQRAFIEMYAEHVLPAVVAQAGSRAHAR
jgi:alkanesulfonate monooxygenase SsuD/methylene tetrahydromethanopterin reductase-like flavin-dependent oxidoreductase (luciferase family)